MNLKISLANDLVFKNPVLSASGTFAYGEEFSEIMDLDVLGGIVTKGLGLLPKIGNPTPRITEASCGIINAIGLENVGSDVFLEEKLPHLRSFSTPVILNFFGTCEDEYVRMAEKVSVPGISALEMNVSCPNVKSGGIEFGRNPDTLFNLVCAVRQVTAKPLIVKLSPMVTDITAMAVAAKEAGADALTCINTIPAMAVNEETMRPVLGNVTGGLSGPAIKPIALKMVRDVHEKVDIPIIASGGATSAADVIQFMLCGASAVEIGSAALRDPFIFPGIVSDIKDYMARHEISEISSIIGALRS